MNIAFIGIDPGVSGAVSSIHLRPNFYTATVDDLPVTTNTFLLNQSKTLDIPVFAEVIEDCVPRKLDYAVLVTEQMQSMGFKTPARTLTMLAEMAGNIEAAVRLVCRERNVPLFIRKYQPKTWTHWMFPNSALRTGQKTEAKHESLEKARQLFPELQKQLNLTKHHDRAEALLLAFTALAETQGCIVDPKLKTTGALVDIYLTFKQDAKTKTAKVTDIFDVKVPDKILLNEIITRKNNYGRSGR
jgi:hypothetical protein